MLKLKTPRLIVPLFMLLTLTSCAYFDTGEAERPDDLVVVDEIRADPITLKNNMRDHVMRNSQGSVQIYGLDGQAQNSSLQQGTNLTSRTTNGAMDIMPSKAVPVHSDAMQGTPAALSSENVSVFPMFGGNAPTYGLDGNLSDRYIAPSMASSYSSSASPAPGSFK